MKNSLLILTGCALMISTTACNNSSQNKSGQSDTTKTVMALPSQKTIMADDAAYTKDSSGLDYKWVTHGDGKQTAALGDFGALNVIFKIGDSTLANTFVQNHGMPVTQQIKAPAMKGDLMAGLAKMKAGDSVVFRMLVDTFFARVHQPIPSFTKSGEYMVWQVKMVNVMSKTQMDAEMANKNKGQNDIDDKKLHEYFKAHNIKNPKKTASGMYYVITKQGSGAHPKAGQQATVNYTGQNLKGEKFDSNVDPAFHHVSPFEFTIGGGVIAGWSEAVPLMNKGMKATFYIPSSLAYGQQAKDAKIGANEVLIFDIELISFK